MAGLVAQTLLAVADVGQRVAHVARAEVGKHRVGHLQVGLHFLDELAQQLGQFQQCGAARSGHVEDVGRAGFVIGQREGGADVGLHHVVDVAEVAAGLAVAVDLHRFLAQQRGDPARDDGSIGAVGVLTGAEDVEIAHAGHAHAVAARVGAREQFVGSLGGGVGREHVAGDAFHLGQGGMVAVDRAGGGVDEGLHLGLAGGVDDFHEAGDVGLERDQRGLHRAGHGAQGGLVQHVVHALDDTVAEGAVADGSFLELQAVLSCGSGGGHDGINVGLLAGREVVDGDHRLAGQCQRFGQVRADEACGAGHEPARLAPGDQGGNVHGGSGIYSGFCGKGACGACARARRGRREHGCTKISEVRQKGHQCPYGYSKLLEKFQIVAAI